MGVGTVLDIEDGGAVLVVVVVAMICCWLLLLFDFTSVLAAVLPMYVLLLSFVSARRYCTESKSDVMAVARVVMKNQNTLFLLMQVYIY